MFYNNSNVNPKRNLYYKIIAMMGFIYNLIFGNTFSFKHFESFKGS